MAASAPPAQQLVQQPTAPVAMPLQTGPVPVPMPMPVVASAVIQPQMNQPAPSATNFQFARNEAMPTASTSAGSVIKESEREHLSEGDVQYAAKRSSLTKILVPTDVYVNKGLDLKYTYRNLREAWYPKRSENRKFDVGEEVVYTREVGLVEGLVVEVRDQQEGGVELGPEDCEYVVDLVANAKGAEVLNYELKDGSGGVAPPTNRVTCLGNCLLSKKRREEALLNALIRDMQALWQINFLQWPWGNNLGFV